MSDPQQATVLVEVVVEKEPTNEAEHWTPPSAEAVAAFINGTLVHRETDDGWRIVGVWEPAASVINRDQAEAMCRLLIDSGDMTPMAQMQLRKLWESDEA